MEYAYVNGKIVPAHRATISIFDRGLCLGDGLFETLRAVEYVPEFFHEHYRRLNQSAVKLQIRLPVTSRDLSGIVHLICKKSKISDAAVRITLTRGRYTGGLAISRKENPSLIVSLFHVRDLPESIYEKGVRVAVSMVDQSSVPGVAPSLKTINYLSNILAKAEADKEKCYEAILSKDNGEITELSTANFFCVMQGQVVTPELDSGILPGITRQAVLRILAGHSLPHAEKQVFLKDIPRMSEAFLTSSVRGIVPITKIGRFPVGTGSAGAVYRKIRGLYRQTVKADRTRRWRSLRKSEPIF